LGLQEANLLKITSIIAHIQQKINSFYKKYEKKLFIDSKSVFGGLIILVYNFN